VGLTQEKPPEAPAEAKKEEPKRDPKSVEYEKAVKDLKKTEGLFTFYQRRKEILLELPENRLGQMMYVQATLSTGAGENVQAGDPVNNTDVFRMERQDDQVNFIRPNLRFRWQKSDPLDASSRRSFPEAILASYRIEQTDPEKKLLLVNLGSFFNGELFRLSELINSGLGGQYMLDGSRSGVERIGSFPENSVVQMSLVYNAQRVGMASSLFELLGLGSSDLLEDSRSLPLKVTYNLWYPKASSYIPRFSDARVGYFTTDFYDLKKFYDRDRTTRYVQRWNLKKKNPGTISEPVKPIVFTIDPSIPPAYRQAVRDGVLRWNKAFDSLGYRNAVVVQDAPKDDPNYDHADQRYNVIRTTITEGSAYAVALFRTDPFTGEITNASVTIDANFFSFYEGEQQDLLVPASTALDLAPRLLINKANQPRVRDRDLWQSKSPTDSALKPYGWQRHQCEMGEGLRRNAVTAWNALLAIKAPVSKEEYAKQALADTVSHEVGHCLGLRHNFIASTYLTTSQLGDDKLTSQTGYAASVMDYSPANIVAILKGKGTFYMPTIGPYDMWAIRYGYEGGVVESPDDEKFALSQIARLSGQPGLAYNTDENADDFDPAVQRWDGAKDSVAFSSKMIEALARIRGFATKDLPRAGESYDRRTRLLLTSLTGTIREGANAVSFIGGLNQRRQNAGDSNQKAVLSPVPAVTQRAALQLITTRCLGGSAFEIPVEARINLGRDQSNERNAGWTAPIRQQTALLQALLVAQLLSADRVNRIAENAYKLEGSKDIYTLTEHYTGVVNAVFGDVAEVNPPSYRRDLQQRVLGYLMDQAGSRAGELNRDAQLMATSHIRGLKLALRSGLKQKIQRNPIQQAHIQDLVESIDRFFARRMTTTVR
jgi:hypothetical protein